MTPAARLLTALAAFVFFLTGCRSPAGATATPPRGAAATPNANAPLAVSPNKLVGRVLAVDAARGFAFVDLSTRAPAAALADGAALVARTDDLRETARLLTTRQLRGRTLGALIVSGTPSVGDEVVWSVP
jgi:hypothetical protein